MVIYKKQTQNKSHRDDPMVTYKKQTQNKSHRDDPMVYVNHKNQINTFHHSQFQNF